MVDAYGVEDKLLYYLVRSFVTNAAMQTERNVHTVIDQWSNDSLDDRTAYAIHAMENKNDYASGADLHAQQQVIKQFCHNSCTVDKFTVVNCIFLSLLHKLTQTTTHKYLLSLANQRGEGGARSLPNVQQALQDTARNTQLTPSITTDVLGALQDLEPPILEILQQALDQHRGIKWYCEMIAQYSKLGPDGDVVTSEIVFRSRTEAASNADDITNGLAVAYQEIYRQSQEFEQRGSGWSLDKVKHATVKTVAYQPIRASSYIELPGSISLSKAVINVKNMHDNKCILWSLLAHLHPVAQNPERITKYNQYVDELNMDGVSFPTPLKDVRKIELNNNLSINVLGYEPREGIVPLRRTPEVKERHINLLLIKEGDNSHYCLVKNLSRLLGKRTYHNGQHYYCSNCLHGFTEQRKLDEHIETCYKHRTQKLVFPDSQDAKVHFKNVKNQLRAPFVIYADFECYTTRIATCDNNPTRSSTTNYQKHEPSGFSYIVVSSCDRYTRAPVVYRGKDVVSTFFKRLIDEEKRIVKILDHVVPMVITPAEEQVFQSTQICHICEKVIDNACDKVRDHDHLTGAYRGAAHNVCNLSYTYAKDNKNKYQSFIIPVVFHNLRGYDGHILMAEIGKYKWKRLSCIPNNQERYIAVQLGTLRFIDSFQFMSSSLESLVSNLAAEGLDKFKLLSKFVVNENQRRLLLRKGVYPYDYMDSPKKMEDAKLPPKEAFYSELYEAEITDEDYQHAHDVWNRFFCINMGHYHDVYLRSDTILLADVFENFRNTALSTYKLDPAHYVTAPGLSWDSMLRYTGVELQLLEDLDMYLMIESGIRGGVSMITKKYAQANNEKVADYDPNKAKNYLMYLDANNLYGWAMSQKMPKNGFQWLSEEQQRDLDVTQVPDNSDVGYMLEVDLEYPEELHDLHSDLPLAPAQGTIKAEELSDQSRHLMKELNIKGRPQAKLMSTLYDKKKYVIHYINLKLYLRLGMRLVHVHRVVQFHQSYWLKEYISLNTEKRKKAQNAFEKDFYKLMNNSIFGKTMENVRSRVNMELVHKAERLVRITAKPTFNRVHIFNDDLVGAHCLTSVIKLNKPIYVGFAILDISKTLMFQFHYDYIKRKYGDQAKLCFTDTDSLLYDITTPDLYADIQNDIAMFDTSNFPTDHPLFNNVNKKVIGKMKDEMGGEAIKEFVGLRSKMYSLKVGTDEKKTAKGIKKATIRKHLKHDMYRNVLFNESTTMASMRAIQSSNHELYSRRLNKVALSSFDDKRFVLDDKYTTRAHGHYRNPQRRRRELRQQLITDML